MRKWCRLFRRGRIKAQDEERMCRAGSSSENFRKFSIQPRPCIKWLSLLSVDQAFFGRSESEEGPRDKRRLPGLAGRLGSGLFDEGIWTLVTVCDKCRNLHGDCAERSVAQHRHDAIQIYFLKVLNAFYTRQVLSFRTRYVRVSLSMGSHARSSPFCLWYMCHGVDSLISATCWYCEGS